MSRLEFIRKRQNLQRTIIKQGYLKKLPNLAHFGAAFKKPCKRWFIFGVLSSSDIYLEYYESSEASLSDVPVNIFSLNACRSIVRAQQVGRHSNVFTLILLERELSLAADTPELMTEWCGAIESKLTALGNLGNGSNKYVSRSLLEQLRQEGQQRAIVRKLKAHTVTVPDYENCVVSPRSQADVLRLMPAMLSAHTGTFTASHRRVSSSTSNDSSASYSRQNSGQSEYFNVSSVIRQTSTVTEPRSWPLVRSTRPLSLSQTRSWTVDGSFDESKPAACTAECEVQAVNGSTTNASALRPRSMSAIAANIRLEPKRTVGIVGRSQSMLGEQLVPSAVPHSATVSAIAEAEVEGAVVSNTPIFDANSFAQLHSEMMAESVAVTLTQAKDLHHSFAVVDIDGATYIAGWLKHCITPPSSLHVGDRLLTIADQPVTSAKMVSHMLKQHASSAMVKLTVKRLPHAKLVTTTRCQPPDGLGFRRATGSAEILYINPQGPLAYSGLLAKAVAPSGDDICNWYITEINGQPLNLQATETQISERLNGAGVEVSLVVQPCLLVQLLYSYLLTLPRYKHYMVQ